MSWIHERIKSFPNIDIKKETNIECEKYIKNFSVALSNVLYPTKFNEYGIMYFPIKKGCIKEVFNYFDNNSVNHYSIYNNTDCDCIKIEIIEGKIFIRDTISDNCKRK